MVHLKSEIFVAKYDTKLNYILKIFYSYTICNKYLLSNIYYIYIYNYKKDTFNMLSSLEY